MTRFFLCVLSTIVVLAASTVAYLLLGFAEVRGDQPVLGIESSLMRAAVHASVRREAPRLANPVPPTDSSLIAGGRAYQNECAGCHGTLGKERQLSTGLNPPAPQLPTIGTEYTEAQIFGVAKHGIRRTGMFAGGTWYSDQRLWTIAGFISRIKALPPEVREALTTSLKP